MPASLLLLMPFLHKEFYPPTLLSASLRLWPGLPDPPDGVHIPQDLPFSPEQAVRYLEEAQNISAAAAANVPVHALLAGERQKRTLAQIREDMDLSAFSRGDAPHDRDVLRLREARLAAQKILLRTLSLEARLLEIKILEGNYRDLKDKFKSSLGVELDDEDAQAFNLTQQSEEFSEAYFAAPLRVLLENACLLLPEHCTLLFADSSSVSELRGSGLAFIPAPPLSVDIPGVLLRTPQAVPLRQALGISAPHPERPWLERRFCFALWSAR